MRKLFSLLAIAVFATGVSAQQDTLKYRISLKDKAATEYSLKKQLNAARNRIFPLTLPTFRFVVNILMRSASKELLS